MIAPLLAKQADLGRRRAWLWIVAGLLLIVAALDGTTWWIVTRRIEAQIPDFVAAAAQSGWRIESGAAVRSGWPLAATMRFPAVIATRPLGGTIIRWTASTIEVSLRPWQPQLLHVVVSGPQTVQIGTDRPIPIETALTTLSVPLAGGIPTFELRDVVIRAFSGQNSGLDHGYMLRLRHATGQFKALAAGLTADGITLSPALQAPFDGPLAFTAGINMTKAFPDAATPGAAAVEWQQQGGRIVVPSLELIWGPLHVTGSGAGALNKQLQPEGQAQLEVVGAPDVVDALSRAGLVAQGPASAARAVFSLLALATHGGPVRLPITLHDEVLTLAQFPMVRLPILDWTLR